MILTLPAIRAQFLASPSLLRFQWNTTCTNPQAFRQGMDSVAQLIEQKNIRQALVDMNDLPSMGLDDQAWVATTWLPRVAKGAVQRVALVLPMHNMYNQLVVESLVRTERAFMNYDIQFFSNTAEAADWLLGDEPPMLAALHSEWPYSNTVSSALAS
ncbi:hypothetical protein HMJ29_19825 [Hymenobacter taeanensis]|uniref:STAS/SEC14 domain-containing protein n=1 Tax=Hymenobacter taeanensis TaxID=2735321 RepID=A0A6M6BND9_9BACT|nr:MULTISPECIES: hypothetical protein [Hymenobacter]QJX49033.1 hypothetical protein HMJ29_19825 [Hymenobacter taeanensis]UOQ81450.1 hypothetical protein MUN83_01205 [Hymenobacter sp. 5414T-23]